MGHAPAALAAIFCNRFPRHAARIALILFAWSALAVCGYSADLLIPTGPHTTAETFPASGSVPVIATVAVTDANGQPTGATKTEFFSGSSLIIRASGEIDFESGFYCDQGATMSAVIYKAPTATPPTASPATITGTTTTLACAGSDTFPETLQYAWTATAVPSNGTAAFAGSNGTNSAKQIQVTVTRIGSYTFACTLTNHLGLTCAAGSVTVTAVATATQLTIAPSSATLNPLVTQLFTASVNDQFGQVIVPAPTVAWTAVSGGVMTPTGSFTAQSSPGTGYSITGAAGTANATAAITVQAFSYPTATTSIVASETTYRKSDGTGAMTTSQSRTWFGSTNCPASITVTAPIIPTGQNGSGSATARLKVFDVFGRVVWSKDADGFLTYACYDPATGAIVKTIADVDVARTGDFSQLPAGWTTPPGGGKHLISLTAVDDLGRPKSITDTAGTVTCIVYNDLNFEVRTYPAWDAASHLPMGPVHVVRERRDANFQESLSFSMTTPAAGAVPNGTEPFDATNIQTLARTIFNPDYRPIYRDDYVSLAGATYTFVSTASTIGVSGTNYYRTTIGYDARGRANRQADATGTTIRKVFDAQSHLISTWTGLGGVDPVMDGWSPGSPGPMLQVSAGEYDGGAAAAGDGTLTKSTAMGEGGATYITQNVYDFRDRLLTSVGPDNVLTRRTYDNLDRVVQVETFAGNSTAPANLRGQSTTAFDDRGLPYQGGSCQVDPVTGAIGHTLTTAMWYNGRGSPVKTASPAGLLTKIGYDGLGQATCTSTTIDVAETLYADALTLANDTVIEQTKTLYDAACKPICVTALKRKDNDTTSTGALTPANAFFTVSVGWFDRAHRGMASASYGRDPGHVVYDASGNLIATNALPSVATQAAPVPSAATTGVLVTATAYDAAGRPSRVTDPMARVAAQTYDLLGQPLSTIEAYVDGVAAAGEIDTDRTTTIVYNPGGTVAQRIASVPNGTSTTTQTTKYLYTAPANAHWVTNIIYPDSSDTGSSGTNQVKATFDRLGRRLTGTDQRGVVHAYAYDGAGRAQADSVTALPTSVDGAIRAIQWTYDDLGRIQTSTSYNAVSAGAAQDQVAYAYNGYGMIASSKQDHAGIVSSGSPAVLYGFNDGAIGSAARFVRLASITYPTASRMVFPLCPSTGIGDALNRCDRVAADGSGNTVYGQYTYLGAGTTVKLVMPFASNLTLDYGAGGGYGNLDAFGRVVTQSWTVGGTACDGVTYTYDNLGNRLSRHPAWSVAPAAPSGIDESAGYDRLNRITKVNRGTLSSGQILDASSVWNQNWTFDAVGNWLKLMTDADGGVGSATALTQQRTFSAANEISSLTSTGSTPIVPAYDLAGNIVSGPIPGGIGTRQYYTWDAWNRLVKVNADSGGSPGAVIAQFRYGATGQRIRTAFVTGGVTTTDDFYTNQSGQDLEVRRNGATSPYEQYVWNLDYIDSALVRFRSPLNDGSLSEARVLLADANHNVSAVADLSGAIQERYRYDPYGGRTVSAPNGTSPTALSLDLRISFSGRRLDVETGLYYYRARTYDPCLGAFMARDPSGYVDGSNAYEYVKGNAWSFTDPMGLSAKYVDSFSPSPFENSFAEAIDHITTALQDAPGDLANYASHKWGDVTWQSPSQIAADQQLKWAYSAQNPDNVIGVSVAALITGELAENGNAPGIAISGAWNVIHGWFTDDGGEFLNGALKVSGTGEAALRLGGEASTALRASLPAAGRIPEAVPVAASARGEAAASPFETFRRAMGDSEVKKLQATGGVSSQGSGNSLFITQDPAYPASLAARPSQAGKYTSLVEFTAQPGTAQRLIDAGGTHPSAASAFPANPPYAPGLVQLKFEKGKVLSFGLGSSQMGIDIFNSSILSFKVTPLPGIR
ncbi:MAG: RHS repeat-associated core domain-containing protein [Planctomycetes bacterium]|nr:RHS repeat-associated core domain-containing protein [Planctomycetota bacterium]